MSRSACRTEKCTFTNFMVFLLIAAIISPATSFAQQDLPVIIPDLPPREAHIRNHITFEQLHAIKGTDPENSGLVIDLGNPDLHGSIYTGPYPFEAGAADYDYVRYRLESPLVDGKGVLPLSDFFKDKYNANAWPASLCPMTTTVAYRLSLWLLEKNKPTFMGFYDSVVSFRREGDKFVKNPTIIKGPFVTMITSDDPSSIMIALETDEESRATVTVYRVGGSSVQLRVGPKEYQLGSPVVFPGSGRRNRHRVEVRGLTPSTDYLYFVQCETEKGEIVRSNLCRFRTAPERGKGPVTLALVGDSREGVGGGERNMMGSNFSTLSRIAVDAYRKGAELFLLAGDLINGYTSEVDDFKLQLFGSKQAMAGFWRSRPVYPCMGNHESLLNAFNDGGRGVGLDKWPYAENSAEAVFASEFFNPSNGPTPSDVRRPPYAGTVFRFQYGPVLVVAFNNNYWWTSNNGLKEYGGSPEGYIMEDQLVWIEHVLEEAESDHSVRYILLYGHEPVFPCGGHVKDSMWWSGNNNVRAYTMKDGSVIPEKLGMIEIRNRLWKAISQSRKVAAVMSSHEHAYHRTLIDAETPVGVYPKDDTDGDGILDKYSPNSDFVNPTWHITVGTGGAPYYSREKTPWTPVVLSSQEGYTLIKADNETISLKFISITGQVVDEVSDLMSSKKGTLSSK